MENDSNNSSHPDGQQPPFRFNAKVAQFLIIVLIAMGLPIAVAVLGFLEMRKAMRQESTESVVAEPPGLREVLEHAADASWKPPAGLGSTTNRFEQTCRTGTECLNLGERVKAVAIDLGGTVITPERIESGGTRWIVNIPASKSREFDSALASLGFQSAVSGGISGIESSFYEIEIRIMESLDSGNP